MRLFKVSFDNIWQHYNSNGSIFIHCGRAWNCFLTVKMYLFCMQCCTYYTWFPKNVGGNISNTCTWCRNIRDYIHLPRYIFNRNIFYHTPTGNIIWLSCLLLINVNFMAPRSMQFAPCHLIYSDNIHFFCSKFFCEFYAIIKVSHHVKNRKRCICVPNNNALRLHEFGT